MSRLFLQRSQLAVQPALGLDHWIWPNSGMDDHALVRRSRPQPSSDRSAFRTDRRLGLWHSGDKLSEMVSLKSELRLRSIEQRGYLAIIRPDVIGGNVVGPHRIIDLGEMVSGCSNKQRQGTSFPKGPASRSLYRRADRSEASGVKIRSLSSCVNSDRKSISR